MKIKPRCLTFSLNFLFLAALSTLTACARPVVEEQAAEGLRPDRDEFSVMTYCLGRYGYMDRTGDGQPVDMKPAEECEAVLEIIADSNPDILAVQEIGGPLVFDAFLKDLRDRGLEYPFTELLQRGDSERNVALLSRYPIVAVKHRLDDEYSMIEAVVPVRRGYLEADISINPGYELRVFVTHLKTKDYHPLGQTEMRRNEARLLNKHVRHSLQNQPRRNILVVGNMSDHIGSAALRNLSGNFQQYLVDLRPFDSYGEHWTSYDPVTEVYQRTDYMLASHYLVPEYVEAKSRVVRHPAGRLASPHRPVMAVFKARDLAPASEPPTPSYEEFEE